MSQVATLIEWALTAGLAAIATITILYTIYTIILTAAIAAIAIFGAATTITRQVTR